MGRPRRLYSEQEEEERKERRRAQQLEWQRNKRRQGAIASSSSASSISESLAKEKIARLERRRERNRLYERRRRANKTDEDRAREAQRKWEARRRRNATPAEQFPGVTPRFRREFVENLSGLTWNRGHFGPDEFQIAPRMTGRKEEKSANGFDVEASEKNSGDYCYGGHLSGQVHAGPRDVQDDSEVQESESILPDDGLGWGGSRDESTISANAIKTEPPDYVEQDEEPGSHLASVKSESKLFGVDWKPNSLVPALTKGVDGSSGNGTMAAVRIKTEPPEYVEQDEEPSCHLVSVKSEPEWYEEVWEPRNPVPALTEGEPPDPMDVTKVTFHTNPEPQVSEEARQRGNAAVAVKIEPQDPTEVDNRALSAETGLGAAAPKEFRQDAVPVNPIGSYSVLARPPQWVFPANSDKAQPQVKVIYFRKVEQGIAMQPVMTTLPVAAVQSLLAAKSQQLGVTPAWLPGSGPGAASSREIEQHRVHVASTLPVQPPRHAPSAVCKPQEDLVRFHEVKRS